MKAEKRGQKEGRGRAGAGRGGAGGQYFVQRSGRVGFGGKRRDHEPRGHEAQWGQLGSSATTSVLLIHSTPLPGRAGGRVGKKTWWYRSGIAPYGALCC